VAGLCFAGIALIMAGLPPLSGFIAKFTMISAAFSASSTPTYATWGLMGAMIASGLFVLVSMVRNGINIFWASMPESELRLRLYEIVPVVGLLLICVAMAVIAGPVMTFLAEAAAFLHSPNGYAGAVLSSGGAG